MATLRREALYTLMRSRRSVRRYKTRNVTQAALQRILKAGFYAPSGADRSGYEFVVVKNPGLKAIIRKQCEAADAQWHSNAAPWLRAWLKKKGITPSKPFLEDAPFLVCVFGDNRAPYWLGSTWLAVGYMLLAAQKEGLATLTYTPGKSKFLQKLLKVQPHHVPITILPLGFADEQIPAKSIKAGTRYYLDRMDRKGTVRLA